MFLKQMVKLLNTMFKLNWKSLFIGNKGGAVGRFRKCS